MNNLAQKGVVEFIPDGNTRPSLSRAERDAEICRLWQAKWTSRKIAAHLNIPTYTVTNVVHKNGLARRPRGSRVQTVALADAPVEAWQQAMLPKLEAAAEAAAYDGIDRRAVIFLALLRTKPYASLPEFEKWLHDVTGYDPEEIALFINRARDGHIIGENGQVDPLAYAAVEKGTSYEEKYMSITLMVAVLRGIFNRDAAGNYTAAPDQLQQA
jgi:hypothetical protein